MAVPFAPAGVSVAEYELRRDVTTREQLRLLEEILKERRRQSRIAKLRLVAGATFACLSLSILYFLVFPKVHPALYLVPVASVVPFMPNLALCRCRPVSLCLSQYT